MSALATTTIQVDRSTAEALEARAASAGQSVREYLGVLVSGESVRATHSNGTQVLPNELSFEEWQSRLREWAGKASPGNPNVDDSRESIYEGCGE